MGGREVGRVGGRSEEVTGEEWEEPREEAEEEEEADSLTPSR